MLTELFVYFFRGNISGFILDDERVVKLPPPVPPPAPPPAPVASIHGEKKKKKEIKKRKRSSSSDSDSKEEAFNAAHEEVLLEKDSFQRKKKERKLGKEEQMKHRLTASRGQENNSPPPRTTTAATTTDTNGAVPATDNTAAPRGNENIAWRASIKRTDCKNGIFSTAENDLIRQGVISWAQARNLSTTDFSWIFTGTGQRSSEILGLWKHVALALPWRRIKSVALAGNRLLHPYAKNSKWSPEKDEELRSLVAELGHGNWSEIGARMKKTRANIKVRYTQLFVYSKSKKGFWTTDEENKLRNAVEEFLQARKEAEEAEEAERSAAVSMHMHANKNISESNGAGPSGGNISADAVPNTTTPASPPNFERKIERRRVLDNITWSSIAQKVGTRNAFQCFYKWYGQLSPSMIIRGDWGRGDDKSMLKALWRLGDIAEYEVQWDKLVPKRTTQQARRRWRLMIKGVPEYKEKEFSDVVEYLVNKHIPYLVEREPRDGRQQNAD